MVTRLPSDGDTIAAIATATGPGGIGIVRLSGPRSEAIASKLSGKTLIPRTALWATLQDSTQQVLDEGVVLYFPLPASFTGEDVVELQCHGSPVQLQVILRECLSLGARHAKPGEFSQRAFLNGKLDLVQAEAIADLIESGSETAARSALRSLSGKFSRQVGELLEKLIKLRVFIEAAIDFPEEEVDFIAESDVLAQLAALREQTAATLTAAQRGRALRDGIKVVLAGAPNAGKSSLLNQFAGQDTAIVTDTPGTTRDLLREHINIDGLPLHIIDTAGLRASNDPIEQEGIRRAKAEVRSADRVLLISDSAQEPDLSQSVQTLRETLGDEITDELPITIIQNKCDLSGKPAGVEKTPLGVVVSISAKTGEGVDSLRQLLLESAGLGTQTQGSSDFSARQRHIDALTSTQEHLHVAENQLRDHQSAELVAEDLRYAQDALSAITGEYSSDDLLGEIFSSFCIGK